MRIENNVKRKHMTIGDLRVGDCFVAPTLKNSAEVFIACDFDTMAMKCECVSLCSGVSETFNFNSNCTRVSCHLVIDDLREYS